MSIKLDLIDDGCRSCLVGVVSLLVAKEEKHNDYLSNNDCLSPRKRDKGHVHF